MKKRFIFAFAIWFLILTSSISTSLSQNVDPLLFSATLNPGESAYFEIWTETGSTPIPSIDVFFAIDLTGSMSDEIAVVKDKAISIMNGIRAKVPDSWFGLMSFMDYPGYYTYEGYSSQYGDGSYGDYSNKTDIELTEDTVAVNSAVNMLSLGSGDDAPEDYTRILYEAISAHWRNQTKKIVILFGDAPTHDLDFAGYNFGGDPGRDAVAGTADDLDFETVVGQVATEGITVLAVQGSMGEPMRTHAEATFKGMSIGFDSAPGTNGQYFQLSTADEIPAVVDNMVQQEVETIEHLTLDIPDEYKDWVEFSPAEYTDVGPLAETNFQVTVTVPEGTETSEHAFMIRVLGDGALLGSTEIIITIPSTTFTGDLGFRPNPNGYSFKNFGTSQSWGMFKQFFGEVNVEHLNGDRKYVAEQFFNDLYKKAGGKGSCAGISASSMISFKGVAQPNAGAYATPYYTSLYEATQDEIRDSVAYYQACQTGLEIMNLYSIEKENSPNYFYSKIKSYISNGNPVTIALKGGTNGFFNHEVAPYRYKETGDMAYVYIYDSNYYGDASRRIEFNLKDNTWSYATTISWVLGSSLPFTYKGDVDKANLSVTPLSMYLNAGIPIWDIPTSLLPAELIGVQGSVDIILVDNVGRRTGYMDDQYFDEIPGVVLFAPSNSDDEDSPHAYLVPSDIRYATSIMGTDEGTMNYNVFSGGALIQILNSTVHPSTVDTIETSEESPSFTYTTTDTHKTYSAVISEEITDASRIVTVKTDISSGERTTLELVNEKIKYVNSGQQKTYDLVIEQRGPHSGSFAINNLEIGFGDTQTISVEDWSGLDSSQIFLEIDKNSDGTVDETKLLSAPIIDSLSGPSNGYRGDTVTFTVSASDPEGDPLTYEWKVDSATISGQTDETFDYAIDNDPSLVGPHTIYVRAKDNSDQYSNWESVSFATLNNPPFINVIQGPNEGYKNVQYAFNTVTTDLDDDDLVFEWKVGEKYQTSTGPTLEYMFAPGANFGEYLIQARVKDSVGDYSSWQTHGFTLLNPAAPVTVNNYEDSWHTSEFSIILTATDPDGIQETFYKINNGGTETVSFDGQPRIVDEAKDNLLEYWSVDNLGNEEVHKFLDSIKLDNTGPTGSIQINSGVTSTTSTLITLTLSAQDTTSGVAKMRLSNDGNWDEEDWENALSTKQWTLSEGEGEKIVYYQLMDNAGLVSSIYSSTITYTPEPSPTQSPSPTPSPAPIPASTPTPSPSFPPQTSPPGEFMELYEVRNLVFFGLAVAFLVLMSAVVAYLYTKRR